MSSIRLLRGSLSAVLATTKPLGTPAITTDSKELLFSDGAEWILAGRVYAGTITNRPNPGILNQRLYYATDTAQLFLSYDGTWLTIGGGGGSPTVRFVIDNTDLDVDKFYVAVHNLGNQYNNVTIYDEHDVVANVPTMALNTAEALFDFSSMAPLSGTWTIVITG